MASSKERQKQQPLVDKLTPSTVGMLSFTSPAIVPAAATFSIGTDDETYHALMDRLRRNDDATLTSLHLLRYNHTFGQALQQNNTVTTLMINACLFYEIEHVVDMVPFVRFIVLSTTLRHFVLNGNYCGPLPRHVVLDTILQAVSINRSITSASINVLDGPPIGIERILMRLSPSTSPSSSTLSNLQSLEVRLDVFETPQAQEHVLEAFEAIASTSSNNRLRSLSLIGETALLEPVLERLHHARQNSSSNSSIPSTQSLLSDLKVDFDQTECASGSLVRLLGNGTAAATTTTSTKLSLKRLCIANAVFSNRHGRGAAQHKRLWRAMALSTTSTAFGDSGSDAGTALDELCLERCYFDSANSSRFVRSMLNGGAGSDDRGQDDRINTATATTATGTTGLQRLVMEMCTFQGTPAGGGGTVATITTNDAAAADSPDAAAASTATTNAVIAMTTSSGTVAARLFMQDRLQRLVYVADSPASLVDFWDALALGSTPVATTQLNIDVSVAAEYKLFCERLPTVVNVQHLSLLQLYKDASSSLSSTSTVPVVPNLVTPRLVSALRQNLSVQQLELPPSQPTMTTFTHQDSATAVAETNERTMAALLERNRCLPPLLSSSDRDTPNDEAEASITMRPVLYQVSQPSARQCPHAMLRGLLTLGQP